MNDSNPLFYECPYCGQGGLEEVKIKCSPPKDAVACAECDRIWLSPQRVGFHNDEYIEIVFPKLGLEPYWSSLETIRPGVPRERISPDYLVILDRAKASGS